MENEIDGGVYLGLRDYLDVFDAADLLQIHPESVRRLIRNGQIDAVKLGAQWLIPRFFIETFAATYRNVPGNRPKEARARKMIIKPLHGERLTPIPRKDKPRKKHRNSARDAVYQYIVENTDENGIGPNLREIARGCGLAAYSAVKYHVDSLVMEGRIERAKLYGHNRIRIPRD